MENPKIQSFSQQATEETVIDHRRRWLVVLLTEAAPPITLLSPSFPSPSSCFLFDQFFPFCSSRFHSPKAVCLLDSCYSSLCKFQSFVVCCDVSPFDQNEGRLLVAVLLYLVSLV